MKKHGRKGQNPGPAAVAVKEPEAKVTKLEPGEGMSDEPTALKPKVEITYTCDCCGQQFISHRARQDEKLCQDCVELRRALKGFLKRGLSEDELIKRGQKLLGVA